MRITFFITIVLPVRVREKEKGVASAITSAYTMVTLGTDVKGKEE
jgi:hypothetical protein